MKKHVSLISPCVTDERKVMVEVVYGGGSGKQVFNPKTMCERLSSFRNLKCSPRLGLACLDYKGLRVLVNKNGKLVVRKASTKKEALAAADYIAGLII
jgi:hypothetical protein